MIIGKLRTYFTFKFHFEFEQYLSIIKNFDKRSSITKLRISSHRLQIERGKYFRPPIDVEKRVCDYCPSEIEDEIHFLIQCPRYSYLRKPFFTQVQKHCSNFHLLEDSLKFNWLLTNTDRYIITELANYVSELFNIHVAPK